MPAKLGKQGTAAHLVTGVIAGSLIFTVELSATTQYLAWSYRFAPTLGAPWLRSTGLPYGEKVYAPWASLMWLSRADARCWARSLRRTPDDPGRRP